MTEPIMKRIELMDLWRMDATPQQLNAYSRSDLTIFQVGECTFRVQVLGDTLGEYDAQGVLALLDELCQE